MEARLLKLKQLQKRKAESSKQNREELFKEHKEKKISGKLRSLEIKQEKATEELERLDAIEKGEDYDRKKGWDYSMEDHEKWEQKQDLRKSNKKNAGFINYSQLAEQTYKKGISEIKINKYYKKTDDIDYSHKPSKESIDLLLNSMNESDKRKSRRRNDYSETGNYSKYMKFTQN